MSILVWLYPMFILIGFPSIWALFNTKNMAGGLLGVFGITFCLIIGMALIIYSTSLPF